MRKLILLYTLDFPFRYQGAPAYGLLSLAAAMEKKGMASVFCDERYDSSSFFYKLPHSSENIYFFSVMGGYQITTARLRSFWLKKRYPQCLIVWGGSFPSLAPRTVLRGCTAIDYVIQGYGEDRVFHLVSAIEKGKSVGSLDGLSYRENGEIIVNDCRVDPDINRIPLPYFTNTAQQYVRAFLSFKPGREKLGYETARGCASKCIFCYNSLFPRKLQIKSLKTIIKDIKHLHSLRITEFEIYDDTLCGGNKGKIIALCRILKKYNMRWSANMRLDLISKDLLETMENAGAQWLFFGIESLDAVSLQKFKKRISLKTTTAKLSLLKNSKLNFVFSLFPDISTYGESAVSKTIRMAEQLYKEFPNSEIQIQSPIKIPHDGDTMLLADWARYDHFRVKHGQLKDPYLPAKVYLSSFLAYRAKRHFSKNVGVQLLSTLSRIRLRNTFMKIHFEYYFVCLFFWLRQLDSFYRNWFR